MTCQLYTEKIKKRLYKNLDERQWQSGESCDHANARLWTFLMQLIVPAWSGRILEGFNFYKGV